MIRVGAFAGLVLTVAAFSGLGAQEMHGDMEMHGVSSSGVFATPAGSMEAGVLTPGSSYEFTVEAKPGERLSFATMFVHSNDWFYGTGDDGVALFDGMGSPRQGDITSEIALWDAGTEADEKPGEGMYQAPRQSGPNMGDMDSTARVRSVDAMMYEGVPGVSDVLRVTVTPGGMMGDAHEFTVRIENVATDAMLMTMDGDVEILLAPGVWAVHGEGAMPLFEEGAADRGEGLEALAEDGDPSVLAASLEKDSMM